ncbi:MAG: YraN family protein [Thermodesulfobacteriota bacterium]
MTDPRRTTGRRGEQLAAEFLESLGYSVVERNFRWGGAEVDIIVRTDSTLVFVEVKTRKSSSFGSPAEAVTLKKQQQINRVALNYLTRCKGPKMNIRFDVIAVVITERTGPQIEHIPNAFEATLGY